MIKQVVWSNKFKKDYDLAKKRGLDINKLKKVVEMLITDEPLPKQYKDHALSGIWSGFRECHIQPDWLLVYIISSDRLVLTLSRTGTHSDLF